MELTALKLGPFSPMKCLLDTLVCKQDCIVRDSLDGKLLFTLEEVRYRLLPYWISNIKCTCHKGICNCQTHVQNENFADHNEKDTVQLVIKAVTTVRQMWMTTNPSMKKQQEHNSFSTTNAQPAAKKFSSYWSMWRNQPIKSTLQKGHVRPVHMKMKVGFQTKCWKETKTNAKDLWKWPCHMSQSRVVSI